MKYELTKSQKDNLLAGIHKNIRDRHTLKQRKRINRRRMLFAAAAVLIAFIVAFSFLFNNSKDLRKPLTEYQITAQNPFSLPDGSVIHSFDASSIKLDTQFAKRHIHFQGRAVFEVAQDIERPFTVFMENGYAIQVTGTVFEVRTGKEKSVVNLIEGSIDLIHQKSNKKLHLNPGETVYFSKNKMEVLKGKQGYLLGWYRGYYELNNTYLGDICHYFNQTTQAGIELQNNLQGLKVSGRYPYADDPEELLKAISVIYKLDISEKDGKIVIVKK